MADVSLCQTVKMIKYCFSLCRFAQSGSTESLFFLKKNTSSSPSSSSSFPLAQSELAEMSQPISCGIQREQSHYWLMRRQGIKAFILITVMSVCNRAACTCFSSSKHHLLLFLFFRQRHGNGFSQAEREINPLI